MGFLKPYAERIYAITRIVGGVLFMLHGMQKVFGLFGGVPPEAPPFIVYGAGGIELVAGALIAVGLFADFAAFIASGEMAVAFFMGHVAQSKNINPLENHGELAVFYCFLFLYVAAKGSGTWSVDEARRKGA